MGVTKGAQRYDLMARLDALEERVAELEKALEKQKRPARKADSEK